MGIWERRANTFYRLFILSKTMPAVGSRIILWSLLCLDGWSPQSSYFFGLIVYSVQDNYIV